MAPRILVITGPTGSGKSQVGLAVAARLGGEIISADSVQIYKGFDIGSAKASAEELERVPHHLISELTADEPFDAARFAERAAAAIDDITARGKLPVIVGGTGLYLRALLGGMVAVPPITPEAERELSDRVTELEAQGLNPGEVTAALHQWLQTRDRVSAETIRATDRQRVRRALLVSLSSNLSLAALQSSHQHREWRYDAFVCALLPPREQLYRAIDQRVQEMFTAGLVREVAALRAQGFGATKAMASIGYREVNSMLDGERDEGSTIAAIQQSTRHFAKRQYTWWRHQPQRLGWTVLNVDEENVKRSSDGKQSRSLWHSIVAFLAEKAEIAEPIIRFRAVEDFLFGDFMESVVGKPDRRDEG